ncbi:MbtH family protein [Burkholderia gladioli]|uniref:MbtH family protein n=1 Tax=Burkholderia gladioli TaxID=28095 RepID=UPI00163EB79B|nr:MbtH family NRPS accessory protein [Burkholderia gladioli]
MNVEQDTRLYRGVINHEEQYSIWPDDKAIPEGWHEAGKRGNRQDCLDAISRMWTDMRPLSLRRQMAAQGGE